MKKLLTFSVMLAMAAPGAAFAQGTWDEPGDTGGGADTGADTGDTSGTGGTGDTGDTWSGTTTADPAPAADPDPEPVAEEAPAEEGSWTDGFTLGVFADAYYHFNANAPDSDGSGVATPSHGYIFADHHGFGLSFAGIDASYATDVAGATLSLRWGNGATLLTGYSLSAPAGPLQPDIAQAYVTWTPSESFTLDIGQFGTIYGAEVHQSWMNVNYTRGAVFFQLQPFYHTGLRAQYAVNDSTTLRFLVTNGGPGERLDLNDVPGLGAQLALGLGDSAALAVGYFTSSPGGIDDDGDFEDDNDNWNHFVDVVFTLSAGDLSLVFNGDFNRFAGDTWNLGVSLGAQYAVTDSFALALREEMLHFDEGPGVSYDLITSTFTLRYMPSENLVFSGDLRYDVYTEGDPFPSSGGDAESGVFTVTLGATAHFGGS